MFFGKYLGEGIGQKKKGTWKHVPFSFVWQEPPINKIGRLA
jgi:hypothetical protein